MRLAKKNVLVIYHADSEEPRMIVKDAENANDPAWRTVNEDYDGHLMLHMDPDEYNPLNHEQLMEHHAKHIPLHKAWHKKHGHKFNCENQKRDAFREHLKKRKK